MTETKTLLVERTLPHPPEKVWRALTQGPLIEAWLMQNDFEPVVGHVFTLRSKPVPNWNGIIDCKVLEVDPPKRLSYTWGSMGLGTVVTFTLTPAQGGTQLRMEQTGFADDKGPNYQGAKYGWARFLENLEKTVAGL